MWNKLACGALALAGACMIPAVSAQTRDFPNRPVRVVVPTSPGGVIDVVTRLVGVKVTEVMGQPLVVDNRAGASTTIGTEAVARAPADGYTLLSTTLPLVVNPALFKKLAFDVEKDFAPISLLTASPYVLVVHPSVPARTVKELIALAKAKPGALNFSSGGNGTNLHVAAELFNHLAGIRITHVPYKGGGPALASVIAGETGYSFPSLPAVLPQVNAGRLRALGMTSSTRSTLLPGVPTIAESGMPGYEFTSWVGVLAPAKTPPEIVTALNGYFVKAIRSPELSGRLAADGTEIVAGSPAQFAALIKAELPRWAKIVRETGLQAE
ncbi:MAG: tripartite tricarboxylate transporter substrate binding protein [Burkholderiales bacterium]